MGEKAILPIPTHVGIIMDGNGRWARARSLPHVEGHRQGANALKTAIETAVQIGIRYLTVYSFSTENWKRPEDEIFALKYLFKYHLEKDVKELHEKGVRIRFIGDFAAFAERDTLTLAKKAEELTKSNERLTLAIALNYGGRQEIVRAFKEGVDRVNRGELNPQLMTEQDLSGLMYTSDMPDPDLIIRTSGEQRLSNFLIWQAAYAEFAFPDVLWPDFSSDIFKETIAAYQKRERRYGQTGLQS